MKKSALKKNGEQSAPASAGFGRGFTTVQQPAWTLADVALATNGLILSGDKNMLFRSMVTDSRQVQPGDLFVAIAGERFDGMIFIEDALRRGALGLVVGSRPERALPTAVVVVQDTLVALGDLAHYRRDRISNLRVVAITGSCGKTTVKEMTALLLSRRFHVLKTEGNFNNLIGLPLSLLPVDVRHEVAVLEMGMNHPGEIARLTRIAAPDVACITNIGGAHLEGLGNIAGVARAKAELFDELPDGATMVVNIDDPNIRRIARRYHQKQLTFGLKSGADVRALRIMNRGASGMAFTLRIGEASERVRIPGLGRHSVVNALAAAAMASVCGLGIEEIALGLSLTQAADRRLRIEEGAEGVYIINDCYNANPSSMTAALRATAGLCQKGERRVAILADMLELGTEASLLHRVVGKTVATEGFARLLAVGQFAPDIVRGAQEAGMTADHAQAFSGKEELLRELFRLRAEGAVGRGDWILVKGSRGMHMETVVEAIK